jgi:hypothetical protein
MAVMRRANNEKINQQRWGGSNWRTIGTILGAAGLGGGLGYLAMKHPQKVRKYLQKGLHGLGSAIQTMQGPGSAQDKGVALINQVAGEFLPGASINPKGLKFVLAQ